MRIVYCQIRNSGHKGYSSDDMVAELRMEIANVACGLNDSLSNEISLCGLFCLLVCSQII